MNRFSSRRWLLTTFWIGFFNPFICVLFRNNPNFGGIFQSLMLTDGIIFGFYFYSQITDKKVDGKNAE